MTSAVVAPLEELVEMPRQVSERGGVTPHRPATQHTLSPMCVRRVPAALNASWSEFSICQTRDSETVASSQIDA